MSSLNLLVFDLVSGKTKRKPSVDQTIDFSSVRIGASFLEILEASGHFDFSAKKLTNIADGVAAQDAVSYGQFQAALDGLRYKAAARVLADSQTALTGGATLTIDGVALANGDRVILAGQTDPTENGWYAVSGIGTAYALARTSDADVDPEIKDGSTSWVGEGSSYADTRWTVTSNDPIVIGSSNIAFVQTAGAGTVIGGAGVNKSGGTLSVDLATNPGLEFDAVGDAGKLRVKPDATGGANLARAIDRNANGIAVKIDDSTIGEDGSQQLFVKDAGITETQLASSVAGAGLSGGAGSPLAVNAGDGIKILSDNVAVKYHETFTNVEGGAITVGQVVFESSFGNVQLAQANDSLGLGTLFGVVFDASIADTVAGEIYVRKGGRIGGFSGLTVNAPVYLSRDTAGAVVQDLTGFVAGEHVVQIGYAISATEMIFDPKYVFEY